MTGPKYFDNSATDLSFLRREYASGKLALASKSLISSFAYKSRHQLEARRETYPAVGPGNDDLAAFQRLAQDLQDLALELRQLPIRDVSLSATALKEEMRSGSTNHARFRKGRQLGHLESVGDFAHWRDR